MISKKGLFATEGMTKSDRCIHTPGNFAKQNLLYVQEVGRLQSLKPHRSIRENLNSFLFVVVLEGKGSLQIGGKHYDIHSGDCALIDCKEHYEHISDEKEAWKLGWVHFNGQPAKGYYDLFMKYNKNSNVFSCEDVTVWNDRIGELLARQKARNFQAELYCGDLLLQLLNCIIDTVLSVSVLENEQEKQDIAELREQLNNLYADVNVLEIVEKNFGEGFKLLSERFFRQYGISVEEYIRNRRFNAAKELLRFTIKPVEIVATESGIGNIVSMQQMFRENEEMTAEEYRQKWAQWIR